MNIDAKSAEKVVRYTVILEWSMNRIAKKHIVMPKLVDWTMIRKSVCKKTLWARLIANWKYISVLLATFGRMIRERIITSPKSLKEY